MVQPHSTFYGKPISSQTSLQSPASKGCLFSIQNQKGCGYFHASFFSRMALYLGCRSLADESRLYKNAPKRWINENRRIFHYDFLEVGKSKSKQEALMVLEPIEEFYQVGCWSHVSPTQLKKLKERKPMGCWDGRWGVSRVATVWRQNEEEQYPHEHWCKRKTLTLAFRFSHCNFCGRWTWLLSRSILSKHYPAETNSKCVVNASPQECWGETN